MNNKILDTRDIALSVLMDIEVNKTFSNIALSKALKKNQFSEKQDRAFITRLVEGTVESRIKLDYVINQFSKTKVNKCKPLIRCLLRMGTYQILFMDKVPDSAAVNEIVKLARKHGFSSLSGFCNGVLRSISRNKDEICYPDKTNKVLYASVMYSIPEWLVEKLIKDYPDKYEAILEGIYAERKTTLRVNELKITKEELKKMLVENGITVEDGFYDKKALLIDDYDFIRRIPGYKDGLFSVQDESSMCAVRAAGIKKGDVVIDCCAASGGKSSLAAEYLMGEGRVYSMDISEDKLELINENIERLGEADVVTVSCRDASEFDEGLREIADVLIADVPCSGLGIIGRKNDIKYRLEEKQLKELIMIQRSIVSNVIKYMKKGATLLYSTCTINPMENEENVQWITDTYKEFTLVEKRLFLQGVDKCDGFFYAVLKKQ